MNAMIRIKEIKEAMEYTCPNDLEIKYGVKDGSNVIYSRDGKKLLKAYGCYTDDGIYHVKEGTEVICDKAFKESTSFETIILPDTLTHIGAEAFHGNNLNGMVLPASAIDTWGNSSLSIFLAIALMTLKLWQLAELAVPMVVMLVAQVVLMFVFARFVVFNVMGRDYEAAVMVSAFCGFGMGATPNAMANMQALTKKFGPAPQAFFIVPLVGSLFIDFFNGIIITLFMNGLALFG